MVAHSGARPRGDCAAIGLGPRHWSRPVSYLLIVEGFLVIHTCVTRLCASRVIYLGPFSREDNNVCKLKCMGPVDTQRVQLATCSAPKAPAAWSRRCTFSLPTGPPHRLARPRLRPSRRFCRREAPGNEHILGTCCTQSASWANDRILRWY